MCVYKPLLPNFLPLTHLYTCVHICLPVPPPPILDFNHTQVFDKFQYTMLPIALELSQVLSFHTKPCLGRVQGRRRGKGVGKQTVAHIASMVHVVQPL